VVSAISLLGTLQLGVDNLGGVDDDWSDLALGCESAKAELGERGLDLHSLGSNTGGDDLVAGDLLVELVEGGLVEERQVNELITHLTLAPLFLLTLTTAHGSSGLGLIGLLDLGWHDQAPV